MLPWPASGLKQPCAMDGLTASNICRFGLPSRKHSALSRRPGLRVSAASREEPELDKWDQMELKFGRLLGEDPKLTLAKVMARKANPDISYLEVEKMFNKKKGKLNKVVEVPFEVDDNTESSSSDIKLRPPIKNAPQKEKLDLLRPTMKKEVKPSVTGGDPVLTDAKLRAPVQDMYDKSDHPNVELRKPSMVQVDDIETEKCSQLKIQPNLFLKLRKEEKKTIENFTDVTLLSKPDPLKTSSNSKQEELFSKEVSLPPLSKPEDEIEIGKGLQPTKNRIERLERRTSVAVSASLHGKPERPDRIEPPMVEGLGYNEAGMFYLKDEKGHNDVSEIKSSPSESSEEQETNDWSRAEDLFRTGQRVEVEFISCSSRGFVASLGPLLGFLPYRNLGAKWKFLAFESWLRKRGLDPSLYRQSLGILGNYEARTRNMRLGSSSIPKVDSKVEEKEPPERVEDLLEAYDKEKTAFLSSFIGQKIKVNVVMVDKNSRKLMFSVKPKEKEDLVEKKRKLMAKLNVGDIVKCCIKKITYFGIFVEVEGVPALIHQSEVSWDATLDPSSYYKIGQVVDAKVHQLDFGLERITLSLKQITPDPLIETLESVIGDHSSLGGDLQTAQSDVEWEEVESLMKELQEIEGVQTVSKGRFFLSPGLAPTFQVYMASMFQNQYKLLARSGNKVQEVIVQASLDKEQMKAAILSCTNRVQ